VPEYAPGTPSWVELSTPDADAAASFYSEVMGWSTTEPGPPETGGYRMFTLDGKSVAGMMQNPQRSEWGTYISVASADETLAQATAAGGTAISEAMDVMDIGRMAMIADPGGATFGLWEAKSFTGADIVNEPGSLCWNDVLTRDAEQAKAFYTAVFGWAAGKPGFEGPVDYTVWELGGKQVGGMMQMSEEWFPPEVPPHWSVCFAVADADATVAKATASGGTVRMPASDMQIGRFAGLSDPQGIEFTIMQPAFGA
jgi:predicted enzyme related to lactoylglutathione lyase